MAKKTTVSKKTAKLDDKQLDKVQGGRVMAIDANALTPQLAKPGMISMAFGVTK